MDFKTVQAEVDAARRKHAALNEVLRDASVLLALDKGVLSLRAGDGSEHALPVGVAEAKAGLYYQEYDGTGTLVAQADLADGQLFQRVVGPDKKERWFDASGNPGTRAIYFRLRIKAGLPVFSAQRRSRKTVWAVRQNVKAATDDSGAPPARDEFPLHLYRELVGDEVRQALDDPKTDRTDPLTVTGPGLGNSRFWPGHAEDKPLNFTYHGHNLGQMIVSRSFPGVAEPFYYIVPSTQVVNWLQGYIIDTVGRNTAGMAIVVQIMVDVAIGFMPIIGPLYNLAQAGQTAHQLYKNWDKMTGWEKALGGLDILLVTLDVPPAARAAKGVIKLKGNVDTLVKAGVAADEAKSLMVAASVLADTSAARKVVTELTDVIKSKSRPLTPSDLARAEGVIEQMVARLPKAERALAEARFAMRDVVSARVYLEGLDVTEELFNRGLKRLTPESLVAIKQLAKEERTTLATRFLQWSKTDEVAAGMNQIASAARPGHVADLFASVGEETLMAMGRGDFRIPNALAEQVAKQSTSGKAYDVIMKGVKPRTGPPVPGLWELLEGARSLPEPLQVIRGEFPALFLTERQLANLAKLDPKARAVLAEKATYDSTVREIAKFAGSDEAAATINRLVATLSGQLKPGVLAGVIERLRPGFLVLAKDVPIPAEVIREMAKKVGSHEAVQVLLRGTRGNGWLDGMADAIKSAPDLAKALERVDHPPLKAALFARWTMRHADKMPGAAVVIAVRGADAESILAKVHSTFGPDTAKNVFEALGRLDAATPGLRGFVGDLAAGGDKSMGASLTLHFVTQNIPDIKAAKLAFEFSKDAAGGGRLYDLLAAGKHYEFKYWTSVGGQKMESALDEFRRDIQRHAGDGFSNLRWVFSKNVEPYRQAIAEAMMETLHKHRNVIDFKGRAFADVERDLRDALDTWLISFF